MRFIFLAFWPRPMAAAIGRPNNQVTSLIINDQIPGPLIEVNKGDTLVLNVNNDFDEVTTIHSHGIFQRGTPWYDGVPGQTQCGIQPKKSFTYEFQVNQSGTYW
ncbi:multicopper oxidase protein [Gigaspora rosea]|uniref:Multicopper oxidase protein n=1 Tax=Gigaspora rosea TaxID=44941 RepID=A0A397UVL7_9GLOM|nr:multicopper oxidase protein [Gigaspora rosea]